MHHKLMGSVSINGTVVLFFANLCGKVFGAIYRIPLSNMLGTEGIGLYQMAFPIYSFLLTLITGGISLTISKKIAEKRAIGKYDEINKIFTMGKRLSVRWGIFFSIFLILFSYPIAYIQGNANALYGYFAISIGFVFASILGAYRGYYQGFSNMYPTAISQVIEQSTKLILGLTLAYFLNRYGIIWGVVGALLGISLSEIFGFMYFRIFKNIKIEKQNTVCYEYITFKREVLPVSVSYGISPLSAMIDSFLVINLLKALGNSPSLATSLYGIETGMVLPLINIPNVLISALAVTIIPMISYKLARKEEINGELERVFRIILLFVIPCCAGMFILSKQIIYSIYPTLDPKLVDLASKLLKFSSFEMFFLCFVTIINSCLQAAGQAKTAAVSMGIGLVVKVGLTITLVSIQAINILGLVLASFVGYFVSSVISLKHLINISNFKIKSKSFIAILSSSAIMSFFLIFTLKYIVIKNIIWLATIILASAVLYFLVLALFGELKFYEIKKLLQKNEKWCHNGVMNLNGKDLGNIFLAPMAGVSEVGFRRVCKLAGADMTYTEMVNATAILHDSTKTSELLYTTDIETTKAVQIFGHNPKDMANACKREEFDKFDIIDINFGCPMPKIVKNGDGSALLNNLPLAYKIVSECVNATSKPVTCKFRIGYLNGENIAVEMAKVCEEAGAKMICVHGRTKEQMYSGCVDYETIAKVKSNVKIPVIGNGDVIDLSTYEKMLSTGVDAVMIGRGALGNPNLFASLKHLKVLDKMEIIKEHVRTLRKFYNERFVSANMKKHLLWYLGGEKNASKIKQIVATEPDLDVALQIVEGFLREKQA